MELSELSLRQQVCAMVGQEIISEVSQYDLAVEEYLEVAHRSALVIVFALCLV